MKLLPKQIRKLLVLILGNDVRSILNGDITDKVIVVDPTRVKTHVGGGGYPVRACEFFIQDIDEYSAVKEKEIEKEKEEKEERRKLYPLAEDLVYLIKKYDPHYWDWEERYHEMEPVDLVLMKRNKGIQISIDKKAYGDSYSVPIEEVFNPRDLDELRSLCDKLGYRLDNRVHYD